MTRHSTRRPARAILFAAVSLIIAALPSDAAADCEPFPAHRLWGELSHDTVTA